MGIVLSKPALIETHSYNVRNLLVYSETRFQSLAAGAPLHYGAVGVPRTAKSGVQRGNNSSQAPVNRGIASAPGFEYTTYRALYDIPHFWCK